MRPIRALVTAVHSVPGVASLPAGSIKAALTVVQRYPQCLGYNWGPVRASGTVVPSVTLMTGALVGSAKT